MGKISTISAQCDRLRSIADDLVGMDYDAYAYDVRHAADTIKSLSDNLSDMVDCRERARELEVENAKLQALSLAFVNTISNIGCDPCPYEVECYISTEPMRRGCKLYDKLCELGIEID